MSKLIFPELEPVPNNTGTVYRLNWARKELSTPKGGQELPNELRFKLDHERFRIDQQYMGEIDRTRAMAMMEYQLPRPFDTAVRDFCLKPAQAFVEVHFRLLADVATWEHPLHKVVLAPLMLYRFWQFQVGAGLPWHFSGFEELVYRIERANYRFPASVLNIVEEMREHDHALIESLNQPQTPELVEA